MAGEGYDNGQVDQPEGYTIYSNTVVSKQARNTVGQGEESHRGGQRSKCPEM
jgi:hypothetical protein